MRKLVQLIVLMILWLLLTWDLRTPTVIVGFFVSLLVTIITRDILIEELWRFLQPLRFFWFMVYLVNFLWRVLLANLDVAYRVIHPDMPIRPGIVRIKVELKDPLARTILANSITLTPGTLTVDIIDDYYYIHWIYVQTTEEELAKTKIVGSFEKLLKKVFE